ncbi:hypothetical protein ACFQU1_16475 [Chelatococcus sp. GCM10030263]|uniref:hypothetical protein n=1 Tax=Chelatococcus sp. GCM10030263 TaxID=3273387 RepID=UPI0036157830
MDIKQMLMEEHRLRQGTQHDYDTSLPSPQDNIDPTEIAIYIAQLSGELADMSRKARLDVIAYFLEMVREEARKTARRGRPVTEIRAQLAR